MTERIDLKKPSLALRILESVKLSEVTPADICVTPSDLQKLYKLYPDLVGDRSAIGLGDDGDCQSWRGCFGWWRELVETQKSVVNKQG